MAVIQFAPAAPAGHRPIRAAEWCGTLILTLRIAADGNRADLARLSGVGVNTIRSAEVAEDFGRLPLAPAEAIAKAFEVLGFTVWVPEADAGWRSSRTYLVVQHKSEHALSRIFRPSFKGQTQEERNRRRQLARQEAKRK